jgi:hypothetical protein
MTSLSTSVIKVKVFAKEECDRCKFMFRVCRGHVTVGV